MCDQNAIFGFVTQFKQSNDGRSPTFAEIARELESDEQSVYQALTALQKAGKLSVVPARHEIIVPHRFLKLTHANAIIAAQTDQIARLKAEIATLKTDLDWMQTEADREVLFWRGKAKGWHNLTRQVAAKHRATLGQSGQAA